VAQRLTCATRLSPGHADAFLVSAGSGVITLGLPDSPGVPKGAAAGTLTAAYNDLDSVKALLEANKEEGVSSHVPLCVFFYFCMCSCCPGLLTCRDFESDKDPREGLTGMFHVHDVFISMLGMVNNICGVESLQGYSKLQCRCLSSMFQFGAVLLCGGLICK
jgi:hypothetical protein